MAAPVNNCRPMRRSAVPQEPDTRAPAAVHLREGLLLERSC